MRYNQDNYDKVFGDLPEDLKRLQLSEREPSLSQCVESWLERTPGLEEDGFNFPLKFKEAVNGILRHDFEIIEQEPNETQKLYLLKNYNIKKDQFDAIFDVKRHEAMIKRGERRISHKALLGVIMIMLYKEEPRFHQPSILLEELMGIDSLLSKWRCDIFSP